MTFSRVIKYHLLLSLIYKKFGGKDVGFTITLILTLTVWLNTLAVILILTSVQHLELPRVSTQSSALFGITAMLWGLALLIHMLLGKRWAYINESRKYLKSLGEKRKAYILLMVLWVLLTYTVIFPLSLYLYGIP